MSVWKVIESLNYLCVIDFIVPTLNKTFELGLFIDGIIKLNETLYFCNFYYHAKMKTASDHPVDG
jgi:hypothetical protein